MSGGRGGCPSGSPHQVEASGSAQGHLLEAVEEYINCGATPAETMIRDLVACELAYINTDHPQFVGGNRAIATVLERHVGDADGDAVADDAAAPNGGSAAAAGKADSRPKAPGGKPRASEVSRVAWGAAFKGSF
jgi:Dynamin central region